MTSLKVFILAFLACSNLVNSRNEKETIEADEVSIFPFFEIWLQAYENNVKKLFRGVTENIHEQHMKASENLTNGLYVAIKSIRNSQAQSDCIAKYISDVIAVYRKTQETQTACIEEARDETEYIKHNLLSALQSLREEFAAITADIEDCNDKMCTAENEIRLEGFLETFNENIYEADNEAGSFIQEIPPEIIECPKIANNNFFAEVKKIYGHFFACNKV